MSRHPQPRLLSANNARDLALMKHLDRLVADTSTARIHLDPVGLVHDFASPEDQELVGLVAAFLAFGNIAAVRKSVKLALRPLGKSPAKSLDNKTNKKLQRHYASFKHRIYTGKHLSMLLNQARLVRKEFGSIEAALEHDLVDVELREGLARFADRLRGPDPDRSMRHLVSDPRSGSACKRLFLYLRWMVRRADGIDLGVFGIKALTPAELLIPVDTHILRISQNLGFTKRKTGTWNAAAEITAHLREFNAEDPVRYDFALCHMGVSRQCPSRADLNICNTCTLRKHCLQWR